MTVKELQQELEKLIEQGLGDITVAFRHYGNLPPLQEKEITRAIVGAGHVIIE